MANREPRDTQTRETEMKKKTWERPTLLPTPTPREGLISLDRTAVMGQPILLTYLKFREGWTPYWLKITQSCTLCPISIQSGLKI